jgi:hypothetical protein
MPCRGFGEFVIISRAGHILQPQLDGPDGNVLPEQARWLVQWASRHRLKWHFDPWRLFQTATFERARGVSNWHA